MSEQPYAKCMDCDTEFTDREKMSEHLKETRREVSDTELLARGVVQSSHRARVVNPTPEEQQASRVRLAISDALDQACEELWDDVQRGYFTAEEVKAEMWAFDIDTAWEEYVAESEADD